MHEQVGLFGLGESGPAEESPTAGLPRPSDDQSTEAPKAFKGQGENDTEQRNELTDAGPSSATQVAALRTTTNHTGFQGWAGAVHSLEI